MLSRKILCEFRTFFSRSKTDLDSSSLMPFDVLVPEGSAPVTSRPYRVNTVLAKEEDATLNQYVAAGMIWTTPGFAVLEPPGGRPEKISRCSDHC